MGVDFSVIIFESEGGASGGDKEEHGIYDTDAGDDLIDFRHGEELLKESRSGNVADNERDNGDGGDANATDDGDVFLEDAGSEEVGDGNGGYEARVKDEVKE